MSTAVLFCLKLKVYFISRTGLSPGVLDELCAPGLSQSVLCVLSQGVFVELCGPGLSQGVFNKLNWSVSRCFR